MIPGILNGQPTFHNLFCRFPPCYMDGLHFNIYSADSNNATWTAYISTFTMQIPAIPHGQPTFQHLICRFHHATWKAYISTITMQIPAMLHGQPTFQHLFCSLLPFYMDSLHFNIYSADSLHATWTAYIWTFTLQIPSMLHGQPLGLIFTLQIPQNATWTAYIPTFTLQIPAMLHGQPTFQHLIRRVPPFYMDSLQCNI